MHYPRLPAVAMRHPRLTGALIGVVIGLASVTAAYLLAGGR